MYMAALLVCLAVIGCSQKNNWTAFVYPDRENIPYADNAHRFIEGTYRTFEECEAAAIGKTRANYDETSVIGDFECGYKCEYKEGFGGVFMYKETRK